MKPPKTQYAFTHAVLASNKKAAETGKAGALGDTSTSEKPCLEFPSNLTLSRFCLPPLSQASKGLNQPGGQRENADTPSRKVNNSSLHHHIRHNQLWL